VRIAVVGTSGSGKTNLAKQIAPDLKIPYVSMDAINWQPGWRDLNTDDPPEFKRRVSEALSAESWVTDGNYGSAVGPIILGRATHLIWLDYSRSVVMRRVIWRSLVRAITREELWPGTGNVESFSKWLDKDHPIRWAWDTFDRRRAQYEGLLREPAYAHLKVLRLRKTQEADDVVAKLRADRS